MILGVLQARCSSTRLPGKVLRPLLGTPMILREIERLRRCTRLDELVVATSVDPSDDPLVELLEGVGVLVRRGSLPDVLSRFLGVVDEFQPRTVVRLTADNPLTDPEVIDAIVDQHRRTGAEYTSNAIVRTFPRGLDAEAVEAEALRRLDRLGPTVEEREHVTLGIYRRPAEFRLSAHTQEPDRSSLRWTVDLPEDFAFAEAVYTELYDADPGFGQAQILALLERRPELRRSEADIAHD